MISNPVIDAMLNRKSIRKYTDQMPSDEVIETIVRAGQQAPFAYQSYSILFTRKGNRPFGAPLLFTICADSHKSKLFMAKHNWEIVTNDISLLLFAIQDAAYAAQNMVMAAESLGLGSVFLGNAPYRAERIIERYKLPPQVFPIVQLAMGYPAEDPPPRPRFPLDFTLFEDEYPQFTEQQLAEAMAVMDEGYLAQDYYRRANAKIRLQGDRDETFSFDDYSWTEHISRKLGQWLPDPSGILEQMAKCGFELCIQEKEADE